MSLWEVELVLVGVHHITVTILASFYFSDPFPLLTTQRQKRHNCVSLAPLIPNTEQLFTTAAIIQNCHNNQITCIYLQSYKQLLYNNYTKLICYLIVVW